MPASSWKVESLIPHRAPMVLIDGIEFADIGADTAVAYFIAREEWSGNWFALEYMAQAAAALAGLCDRAAGLEAGRPGFLLGTRRLDLGIAVFEPGVKYFVKAVREYSDGDSAAFACEIYRAHAGAQSPRCTATITAFRPPSV